MVIDDGFTVIFLHEEVEIWVIYHSTQADKDVRHQFFVPNRIYQDLHNLVIQINCVFLSELSTPTFEKLSISTVSAVHCKEFNIDSCYLNVVFSEIVDGSFQNGCQIEEPFLYIAEVSKVFWDFNMKR